MNNTRIYLRFIIFISILTWCSGFSLNSITGGSAISLASTPFFNLFYDTVCHQEKDKLISISGFNFLVCARCTGIYLGALIASAILLFSLKKINIPIKMFLTASIILLTDIVLNNFTFATYNKISAFATGVFFGSVCIIIVMNLLEEHLLTKY